MKNLVRVKFRQKFWLTLISLSVTTLLFAGLSLSYSLLVLDQNKTIGEWYEIKHNLAAIGIQINRYANTEDTSQFERLSDMVKVWEEIAMGLTMTNELKRATKASIDLSRKILETAATHDDRLKFIDALNYEGRGLFYLYHTEIKSAHAVQRSTTTIFALAVSGLMLAIFLLLFFLYRNVFQPLDHAYLALVDASFGVKAEVIPMK